MSLQINDIAQENFLVEVESADATNVVGGSYYGNWYPSNVPSRVDFEPTAIVAAVQSNIAQQNGTTNVANQANINTGTQIQLGDASNNAKKKWH